MNSLIADIKSERRWLRKALGILTLHTTEQASREGRRGHMWTVRDTARVLDMSVGYVSESLLLAKCFPKHPEFKDKTRDEALKLIRREKSANG